MLLLSCYGLACVHPTLSCVQLGTNSLPAAGSMAFEENGERINDLKLILGRVAEVATMFDDDGILIRFMNGMQQGNGIRDAPSANNLIGTVQFNGMTPLGGQLDQKVSYCHLHVVT